MARGRLDPPLLPALKVAGSGRQGMRAASRLWTGQGNDSPLEPPEGTQPCQSPGGPQWDPVWTSDLQSHRIINVHCIKPATECVAMCCSSSREQM